MIDEQRFKQLKQRAERARQARDVATGQLEAAMEQLRTEFGCKTVNDAKKVLGQLDKEAKAAEMAFEKAAEDFESKWEGTLDKN